MSVTEVASALVGRRLAAVSYIGLNYAAADIEWDFDQWHHPEVGVELLTDDGEKFCVTWGASVTQFNLVVDRGGIGRHWLPAARGFERRWDVTNSDRWSELVGEEVSDSRLISLASTPQAPVALHVVAGGHDAWFVAAMPRVGSSLELRLDRVSLVEHGEDEVVVVFTQRLFERLVPPSVARNMD